MGNHFECNGPRFAVTEMDGVRVSKVALRRAYDRKLVFSSLSGPKFLLFVPTDFEEAEARKKHLSPRARVAAHRDELARSVPTC
jgi:hypothetical protein